MKTSGISKERLEASIRLAAFLLVIASGVALSLTQKLLISSILLIGVTLAAWPIAKKPARGNFWEIASFFYLVFFLFDLFRISSSLAPALVHLFIFIMINKIFNLHTYRDYYQLYLLSFLTVLAASSLSVEVEMFYMIVFYIILLIWNILSLTLYKEWQKQESGDPFPFSLFRPAYWVLVLTASLLTFGAALAIFFILPRMQLGYFASVSAGKVQHVSGFSQNVNLGDVPNIQTDTNVAMRVRVSTTQPINHHFYWRGMAFDHYDGRSWSAANPGTRFLYEDSLGNYYNARSLEPDDRLIKQEFFMAPLDTRVIFGLDRVVKINGNFSAVTRDDNGTLMGMNRPESYVLFSRSLDYRPESLRATKGRIPENIRHYYLQLPDLSPKISELARSIASKKSANYDRVLAVKKFLETNYAYSTINLPQSLDDPISTFLFEKKYGHCEYFATSMVLLVRSLGIPARLVNGFLEGEFNEIGGFYVVRQSDAHSWVEVYFDGAWVLFDPSPRLAATAPIAGSSFWQYLNFKKVFESISFFWDRYILIFSGQDQVDAISYAQDKYQEMRHTFKKSSQNSSEYLNSKILDFSQKHHKQLFLSLISLLLLLLLLRYYQRWKQKTKISRTPVLFYHEMLMILQRKGFYRPPEKTPAEFINAVSDDIAPEFEEDLQRLTQLFYKSRFGNYHLSTTEQTAVRAALDHLHDM